MEARAQGARGRHARRAPAAPPLGGIEAYDTVLRPLWKGICEHRGKGLAAFLKDWDAAGTAI